MDKTFYCWKYADPMQPAPADWEVLPRDLRRRVPPGAPQNKTNWFVDEFHPELLERVERGEIEMEVRCCNPKARPEKQLFDYFWRAKYQKDLFV